MKIFRKIWVDKKEDLDLSNIGCHWTRDHTYTHNGGGSNGYTINSGIPVAIICDVKKSQINESATAESNLYHPAEKEVVLKPNQRLNVRVRFGTAYGELVEATANTGTRFDKWVENHI